MRIVVSDLVDAASWPSDRLDKLARARYGAECVGVMTGAYL